MLRTSQAKLTQAQADEIRQKYADDKTLTQTQLAKDYKVSVVTIHNIVNNIYYVNTPRKYTAEFVIALRRDYRDGLTYPEMREKYSLRNEDIEYLCLKGYRDLDGEEPRCTPRGRKRKQIITEKADEVA